MAKLVLSHVAKLSKIKQMWHLQMICSKFAIEVNPFFRPVFVWRRHAGAHLDELQHGGQKPTETSVTEFCYKSLNLLLEELINIKVILFLTLELFR